ncbi:MAG: hypothetical protein ACTMHL_08765 [Janibacter sp.]
MMTQFIVDYWPFAAALLPTIGVAFLFYWIIRYMIEADRGERKAIAQWNKEHGDHLKGNRGPLNAQKPAADDSLGDSRDS